jgi:hypothetical protein
VPMPTKPDTRTVSPSLITDIASAAAVTLFCIKITFILNFLLIDID